MTIHGEHPFLPAEPDRNPVRRFRGRLASPVTLWTSEYAGERAGLTVSSLLVANGEPGSIVGLIDPDSELWDTLSDSGRAVVALLSDEHRTLADAFGYVAPAPGGPFKLGSFEPSEWGPVLAGTTWAGCSLVEQVALGWGLQVRLEIAQVSVPEGADDAGGLVHRRGRYFTV